MAFSKLPLLFTVHCGKMDPEAHLFPIPNGPRTHEYLDGYNLDCEAWLREITVNDPHPQNIKRTEISYQRDGYTGRALVYRPDTDEVLPMCIFTHGGSFLFWRPEYYDLMCANISSAGNCVVVNLDFRQNIDVLVPDMYEDAYQGMLEALKQAERLGGDPSRVAIMGDSSGGAMAVGLSMMGRERGTVNIRHHILLAGGIGFDPEDLDNGNTCQTPLMGAQNVVRRGFESIEQSQLKYFTVINDPDIAKTPSTTFIVGTADFMWHDVSAYARILRDAGVDVEAALYHGMPHGFYNGGCGEASADVWNYIGEVIRKRLN